MRKVARRYGSLLRTKGVRGLLLSSFIGRLPVGMGTLLFVLVVHAGTGSYAVAGVAAAANSLATAVCGPPLGRLADRGHAALILVATGVLEAISLVALVLALEAHRSAVVIIGIGAISGVVNPPIGPVTRTVLPRLAPESQTAAFALDALLAELTFVIGPAILGVTIAVASGYAATYVAAGLNIVGAVSLAAASAVRHGYPKLDATARTISRVRRIVGPLASSGMRTVMIVSILQAAAFGVLEVAIPAYTNASGMPQAGGLLFAVWSCGSIAGGLWFGAQDFRISLGRQYAVLMALNMVGFGSILLAGGPYTLGALLFFAGLFIAPANTVEGSLVTELTPPEWTTEAFTWSTTAIYLGFALGSGIGAVALSSSLGSTSALTSAALIAVGLAGTGTLLTVTGRRSLRPAAA